MNGIRLLDLAKSLVYDLIRFPRWNHRLETEFQCNFTVGGTHVPTVPLFGDPEFEKACKSGKHSSIGPGTHTSFLEFIKVIVFLNPAIRGYSTKVRAYLKTHDT
jgi:hypothetical protein